MTSARTILVVEDDDDIRETLVELLADEGHDVLAARDGERALDRLRANAERIDLIVLDLMMPRMSGYELRQHQLAEPAWSRIPVVVLTAGDPDEADLERLTPAACVRKPVRIEDLLDVVTRLMG